MIGGRCNCGDTFSQAVLITRKLPFFTNLQLECRESAGYGSDLSKVTTICSVFGACGLVLHNRVIYFFPDFVGSACSIRQNIRKVGAYSGGDHLFPFRTEKLSPPAQMVLGLKPGRVCRCQFSMNPFSVNFRGFLFPKKSDYEN